MVARQDRPALAELLHRGGKAGTWGSLGLWPTADGLAGAAATDYASACRGLALAVGHAAGLGPGQRVLSVACGAGDELLLWRQHFGAAQVVGLERDPQRAAQARGLTQADAAVQVVCASALADFNDGEPEDRAARAACAGPFDAIVCVDAAYHLSPRLRWLQQCWTQLAPGGQLAYTDLVLQPAYGAQPAAACAALLRGAARLCGVATADLLPLPTQVQRLQALGAVDVQVQSLDDAVLGGFARFACQQAQAQRLRPWQAGWRGVAITAALIGPCRNAGLGYALLRATKPID